MCEQLVNVLNSSCNDMWSLFHDFSPSFFFFLIIFLNYYVMNKIIVCTYKN